MIYDDLTVSKLPEEQFTENINDINNNPTDYLKRHLAGLIAILKAEEIFNEIPECVIPKDILSFILLFHFEAKAVLSAMKENKGLFKIGDYEMESIETILNCIIVKADPILENQVRYIKRLRNEEFLYYLFSDLKYPDNIEDKIEEDLKLFLDYEEHQDIIDKIEEGLKDYDSINFKDNFRRTC